MYIYMITPHHDCDTDKEYTHCSSLCCREEGTLFCGGDRSYQGLLSCAHGFNKSSHVNCRKGLHLITRGEGRTHSNGPVLSAMHVIHPRHSCVGTHETKPVSE